MKLQITIDGRAYAVDVELLEEEESAPRIAPSHSPSTPAFAAAPPDQDVCGSPVNGLVVRVDVQPGQAVEPEQVLLVVEAMKMETGVAAPRAGTVKAVHVKPGDPVKLNQPLVELEKGPAGLEGTQ